MTARLVSTVGRLLAVLLSVILGACSSFDAKWHAAKDSTAAHGPTRWDGRWTSEKHRTRAGEPAGGRLRCLLYEVAGNRSPERRREASGAPELRAYFRANWLIFATDYTISLAPVKSGRGQTTEFRGTHELSKMFGGTYRYTAHIAGDRFTARYDSSYDHGTFDLTRVRP